MVEGILTCGMAAPVESRADPERLASEFWAKAEVDIRQRKIRDAQTGRYDCILNFSRYLQKAFSVNFMESS
jgi:hypothetical protein